MYRIEMHYAIMVFYVSLYIFQYRKFGFHTESSLLQRLAESFCFYIFVIKRKTTYLTILGCTVVSMFATSRANIRWVRLSILPLSRTLMATLSVRGGGGTLGS